MEIGRLLTAMITPFDENGEVEISKNIGESNSALCSITHASVGEYFVTGYKDKNLLIKKIMQL